MKNNNIFMLLMFCLVYFLAGCENKNKTKNVSSHESPEDKSLAVQKSFYSDISDWKVPKPVLQGKKIKHVARPALKLLKGKMAVLYSAKNKVILTYNNRKTVLDSKNKSNQLWLFVNNNTDSLYAFWWRKTKDGKRLYSRVSSDLGKTFSKVVTINTLGGVLPTIDFVSDDNGNLTVVYYDERQPPYRIYVNTSSDNGHTWSAKDTRIDNDKNVRMKKLGDKQLPIAYALNPQLEIFKNGKLVLVWQQRKIVNGYLRLQFATRLSTDHGKSWSEEAIIYTAPSDLPVEAMLTVSNDKAVLTAAYPSLGLLGFVATNNDASQGLSWTEIGPVLGTVKTNEISWLKPAISGDKYKIAYIIQKETSAKYRVEVASLDLSKMTWGKAFRLDRAKKQPVETKATYLDMKVLPNGEFVVAWEDYRSLIPMLMFDYTSNHGENWLSEPIRMTRGGLSTIKYPNIYVSTDKVVVTFEWYISRGNKLPRFSQITIPIDNKTGKLAVISAPLPKKISDKELKNKLRKRVTELMDLRVKNEWESTWEYMDPVYQISVNKRSWLHNLGYVNYEDFKIRDVKVDGLFATVSIDQTLSLRQQIRNDEVLEPTPAKKSTTTTKWLWFYDQWYFFPESAFMAHLKY